MEDVNVEEEYGIGRSFRRGAYVRVIKTRVPISNSLYISSIVR